MMDWDDVMKVSNPEYLNTKYANKYSVYNHLFLFVDFEVRYNMWDELIILEDSRKIYNSNGKQF